MTNVAEQTMPSLFYVSVFDIEPRELALPIEGSCGFLEWHAEIVHADWGGALRPSLVIYQSSRGDVENEDLSLRQMEEEAVKLANTLLLPLTRLGRQHLLAHLLLTLVLDGQGNERAAIWHAVRSIGNLGNHRFLDGRDYPLVKHSPRLRRALQYFNAAMYVSDLGLYADACMNYVRAIEALFGMYKDDKKQVYIEACTRLGVDFEKLHSLMGKIRNRFAIAHASDTLDKPRELKDEPGFVQVQEYHDFCREVIIRMWHAEEADFEAAQQGKDYELLYSGFRYGTVPMPVPTIWADKGLGFGSAQLPSPKDTIGRLHERLDGTW